MKNEKNKDSQEIDYKKTMWAALAFVSIVGGTLLAYYFQEKYANEKIDDCTLVTIAYPLRWVPRATLYYYYYVNMKKIDDGVTMEYPTMGKYERGSHLMHERFFVRVYCKDFSINRIYWNAKVPDTLRYIPANGWKEIPYGLAKDTEKD